jgi:hypothetical protein
MHRKEQIMYPKGWRHVRNVLHIDWSKKMHGSQSRIFKLVAITGLRT